MVHPRSTTMSFDHFNYEEHHQISAQRCTVCTGACFPNMLPAFPKGAVQNCDSTWQLWWKSITTGHLSLPPATSKPTCYHHSKLYKQHGDEIICSGTKRVMVFGGGGQGATSHDPPQVTHSFYNGGWPTRCIERVLKAVGVPVSYWIWTSDYLYQTSEWYHPLLGPFHPSTTSGWVGCRWKIWHVTYQPRKWQSLDHMVFGLGECTHGHFHCLLSFVDGHVALADGACVDVWSQTGIVQSGVLGVCIPSPSWQKWSCRWNMAMWPWEGMVCHNQVQQWSLEHVRPRCDHAVWSTCHHS